MSTGTLLEKTDTMPRPQGGEIYRDVPLPGGQRVTLTYNDLWMLIVCRASMDGDWTRARAAADLVPDAMHKRVLVERLWKLEQTLGGLPAIPDDVQRLNLHRAHQWFNKRAVSSGRNW
jgi:hypothetical protein